jgi:hypothetical protein
VLYADDYRDGLEAVDERGHVPVPTGPGLGVTYNWNNWSAQAMLLPFIEQGPLYERIKTLSSNFYQDASGAVDSNVQSIRLSAFVCPSDRIFPDSNRPGNCNYPMSAGSNLGWNISQIRQNGAFQYRTKTRMSDVIDGTSNTIMIGEHITGDGDDTTMQRHDNSPFAGFSSLDDRQIRSRSMGRPSSGYGSDVRLTGMR